MLKITGQEQLPGDQTKSGVIYKVVVGGGEIDGRNDRAKTTSIMHVVCGVSSVY